MKKVVLGRGKIVVNADGYLEKIIAADTSKSTEKTFLNVAAESILRDGVGLQTAFSTQENHLQLDILTNCIGIGILILKIGRGRTKRMKIKYECVEVRKYAGREGHKQQEGSNPTALHIKLYSLSDGVTYTPNPEWGKHIPGEIYWVDITLAEPA